MRCWRKNIFLVLFAMLTLVFSFNIETKAATTTLPKVTGVKQTNCLTDKIYLEWDNIPNKNENIYYNVYIGKSKKNMECAEQTYENSTWISSVDLNPGTKYYVKVEAVMELVDDHEYFNNHGYYNEVCGDSSDIIECATAPEGMIVNFKKVSATPTSMKLTWNKSKNVDGYLVECYNTNSKGLPADMIIRKIVKNPNVTLKGLTKNVNYHVSIYKIKQTKEGFIAKDQAAEIFEISTCEDKIKKINYNLDKETGTISFSNEMFTICAEWYELQVYTANESKSKLITKDILRSIESPGEYKETLSINNLKDNKMVKVKVRAVDDLWGIIKSKWSDWIYICKQPEITTAESKRNGIKLTWESIDGADRYLVYASTKKNSGYKKVATVKSNTSTVKKFNGKALKNNKNYYFYVVPQKKVNGKYVSVTLPQNMRYTKVRFKK